MNELQKKLKVNIRFHALDTVTRRNKAQVIQNEMLLIMRSDLFKQRLLKKLDERDYQNGELSKWKHASPDEIYIHIMRAQEILNPEADNEVDLWVDDYFTWSGVVGHTYKNDPYIYTNTRFFDVRTSKLNVSNFLHEWFHKLGFGHDFRSTRRRKDSLCYLGNEVYEECWDIMFGEPSANDKVLVCYRSWKRLWFKKCYWKYAGDV